MLKYLQLNLTKSSESLWLSRLVFGLVFLKKYEQTYRVDTDADAHVKKKKGKKHECKTSRAENAYQLKGPSNISKLVRIFVLIEMKACPWHLFSSCNLRKWKISYLRTFRLRWNTTSGNSKSESDFESSDNCSSWNDSALLLWRFCIFWFLFVFASLYTYS